jgi:hypothetical protein
MPAVTTTAGATHGGTRNNGATVVKGGNIDSSLTVSNAPYTSVIDGQRTGYGSAPNEGSSWNQKAISGGTWAQMVEGSYVIRKVTTSLAGVANTTLLFGNSDYGRRSIHWKTSRRSYHITSWDYVTGEATKDPDTNDAFGDDHAATPTRAVPGEYVFTDHAIPLSGALAVPLQGDYEAKTG